MSAFFVSEATLNRALRAFLVRGDCACKACEDYDNLGRMIWALNRAALGDRYGDEQLDDMAATMEEIAEFHWQATRAPETRAELCDVLKALHCVIYQCAEGDCVESDLFDRMQRQARDVQGRIINTLAEYDGAAWDGVSNLPEYYSAPFNG